MASSCWCPIGMTAASPSSSWALNCSGGAVSLCPATERGGLPVSHCDMSSIGMGCRCGYSYRRTSPIPDFKRSQGALGQISAWTWKEFGAQGLNEEVVSRWFSGSRLPTFGPTTEKAIAGKERWLAERKAVDEAHKYEAKIRKIEKGKSTKGAPWKAGRRVNEQWYLQLEASEFARSSCAVLYNYWSSSHPISGANTVEDMDFAVGNLSPARANVEKKEMVGKEQGAHKKSLTLQHLRGHTSRVQDLKNHVNDRWLNRCMHHLLAWASLPRVVGAGTDPICFAQEDQTSHQWRETKVELRVDEDDGRGVVKSRNNISGDFSLQETVIHKWDGYWIGPGCEDGWGFVEAFVSPAGVDQLFL